MAPYEGLSPSVSDERSDDTMFEASADIPTYINGQADSDDSDQQAPVENASDIADLKSGLQLSPKHIPCGYLYNDRGSQLYEEITKLEEYYPFNTERELLSQHASHIVSSIPAGSIVVELGCGNAEKTSVLLHALISRDGPDNVHFLGIDVSMEALHMARSNLMQECPQLSSKSIEMVCADYLEGLKQARARHPSAMLCVLWLGSSVGNLKPHEAVGFFQSMQRSAGVNTQVFLCTDLWKDAATLHSAYCDSKGVTEAFIKNGMAHALHALGAGAKADPACWQYDVVINPVDRRVEMWLVAEEDVLQVTKGVDIIKGERVLMEMSGKFTPEDIRQMAFQSNFYVQDTWRNCKYSMQMLVSTAEAMRRCWKATDALFASIADWSVQPIDVRHPFCFYYGHLASFAKLKMLPAEEMSQMDDTYSRGIDPNMADPSKCHSHPDVPPQWPPQPKVQAYVQQVRQQILKAFDQGTIETRAAYIALEHEWMHLETLAYMLAQEQRQSSAPTNGGVSHEKKNGSTKAGDSRGSSGSSAPTADGHMSHVKKNGSVSANSSSVAEVSQHGQREDGHGMSHSNGHVNGAKGSAGSCSNGTHNVDGDNVGAVNDVASASNGNGVTYHNYGVTNGTNGHMHLNPKHVTHPVSTITIPAGDVTLGTDMDPTKNFVWDNEGPKQSPQQVSSFQMAARPVSNAEFYHFAVECNGYEEEQYWSAADMACLKKRKQRCPATWTLQANGEVHVHRPGKSVPLRCVECEPVWVSLAEAQAYCSWAGGRVMSEEEYGRAAEHTCYSERELDLHQGGWEWTSTPFKPLEGFQPMAEYPEYSADFFDGCHYVVKGSSPYTHISLIRSSFRNYYQKEYPYVFAKFRICKSIE